MLRRRRRTVGPAGAAAEPGLSGEQVGRVAVYIEDGSGNPVRVTTSAPLPVASGAPAAANILNGYQSFAASGGPTTLITIPAGRTWVGTVGAAVAATLVAASTSTAAARAVITTAGAGVTPAAGTVMGCECKVGANAVGGTVSAESANNASMPLTVVAPGGNAVTVQVTATCSGTSPIVDAWASGQLV